MRLTRGLILVLASLAGIASCSNDIRALGNGEFEIEDLAESGEGGAMVLVRLQSRAEKFCGDDAAGMTVLSTFFSDRPAPASASVRFSCSGKSEHQVAEAESQADRDSAALQAKLAAMREKQRQQEQDPEYLRRKAALIQEAAQVYRVVVSFNSLAAGPDESLERQFWDIVAAHEQQLGRPLQKVKTSWGKEGEFDIGFTLAEFDAAQQRGLIDELREKLTSTQRVHIEENTSCKINLALYPFERLMP